MVHTRQCPPRPSFTTIVGPENLRTSTAGNASLRASSARLYTAPLSRRCCQAAATEPREIRWHPRGHPLTGLGRGQLFIDQLRSVDHCPVVAISHANGTSSSSRAYSAFVAERDIYQAACLTLLLHVSLSIYSYVFTYNHAVLSLRLQYILYNRISALSELRLSGSPSKQQCHTDLKLAFDGSRYGSLFLTAVLRLRRCGGV